MKTLKGILIAMVITLVVILGAGGALIGFNHTGHESEQEKVTQGDGSNSNETHQMTKEENNSQEKGQQSEDRNSKSKQVVVASEQVSPEEYLKRIKEAQALIDEANELITSEAYAVAGSESTKTKDSTQQNSNMQGMDKIHQGVYKLAQGKTLMNQALEGMEKEIKKSREANQSFYQIPPSTSNNYYYVPNNGWAYPNQNQMMQPNQDSYPTTDPNILNNMNGQNGSNTNSHTSAAGDHNTGMLMNLFSSQNITLIVYGFLFLSVIGIFVAIAGYLNSLFKPKRVEQ